MKIVGGVTCTPTGNFTGMEMAFFCKEEAITIYTLYIYIYIYIYCHPQTDCFVLSELFSVARHVGHSKPRSKPIQLYVRLSLRLLGQQAYHIWLRELLRYLFSNSSSHYIYSYTHSYTLIHIYMIGSLSYK